MRLPLPFSPSLVGTPGRWRPTACALALLAQGCLPVPHPRLFNVILAAENDGPAPAALWAVPPGRARRPVVLGVVPPGVTRWFSVSPRLLRPGDTLVVQTTADASDPGGTAAPGPDARAPGARVLAHPGQTRRLRLDGRAGVRVVLDPPGSDGR